HGKKDICVDIYRRDDQLYIAVDFLVTLLRFRPSVFFQIREGEYYFQGIVALIHGNSEGAIGVYQTRKNHAIHITKIDWIFDLHVEVKLIRDKFKRST